MQFDPKSAAPTYAEKDADELIQIGFLEQYYTDEAKALAKAVLASRGLKVTAPDIERVRLEVAERKREALEYSLKHLESNDDMPSWRRRARASLAPYRRVLSVIVLALIVLAGLNWLLEWHLLNLDGRESQGVILFVGLFVHVFLLPSREDHREQGKDEQQ